MKKHKLKKCKTAVSESCSESCFFEATNFHNKLRLPSSLISVLVWDMASHSSGPEICSSIRIFILSYRTARSTSLISLVLRTFYMNVNNKNLNNKEDEAFYFSTTYPLSRVPFLKILNVILLIKNFPNFDA